jgi:hypothetical protein
VLDHRAVILDRCQAGRFGSGEPRVVGNAHLEPYRLRTDGNGVVDDRVGLVAADEDVNEVDLLWDVAERCVRAFAEDFVGGVNAAVDGDDVVAVLLEVGGDAVGWAVRPGIKPDDGDCLCVLQS